MDERDIFHAALAIDGAAQRARYLDRVCAGDAALREHLEGLLEMHGQLGSFLEAPAAGLLSTVDEVPVGERPGTVIGSYKLLEQIGEGGFGVVFMAEQQQPLRRKVALKVLKPGMDSRQVVARFEQERQALALMDHPNIAHVFDGGQTATGRPYFVMELVRGIPITDYCDQHRLGLRERLGLFVSVCAAVQHAHQKGIIHRDLKPSNILVTMHDGVPVAKVIDFGIAKALGQHLTDKTLFTGFAQMIGTPLYMSPEQAALSGLDVDTRSDVYSLGVVLYELLTGTTPFDRERLGSVGYDELRRIIREEEPPRPSTRISTLGQAATTVSAQRQSDPKRLSQLFRGELDWIVMKALEKDRNRRYESASAFAADVQRYLHDEPVQACPPSAGYRLKKFVRRNRRLVSAVAVVVLGLVVGIAGAVVGLVRARDEAESARLARDAEAAQHGRAQENLRLALQVLEDIYLQIAQDRAARDPQRERQEQELLKRALRFYQQFADQNSAEPATALEVIKAKRRVGDIQRLVGQHDGARTAYLSAIEQQLSMHFPDEPQYVQELAACRNSLGELLIGTGELPAAQEQFQRAVDSLGNLTQDPRAPAGCRAELARGYHGLGLAQKERGDRAAAEAQFGLAIDVQSGLKEEFPQVPEYRADLAEMHRDAGRWLRQGPGDERAAEEHLKSAAELLRGLVRDYPGVPLYRQRLALCLTSLSRWQEAAELQRKLIEEFPSVPDYRLELALSYSNEAFIFWRQGSLARAGDNCDQALVLCRKLAADFPNVARYRRALAIALSNSASASIARQKDLGEIVKMLEEAISCMEPLVEAQPQNQDYASLLVAGYASLGTVLGAMGKDEEAAARLRQAEEAFAKIAHILLKMPGGTAKLSSFCNEAMVGVLGDDAAAWHMRGNAAQSAAATWVPLLKCYGKAIEIDPTNGRLFSGRGSIHERAGKPQDALADYERAVTLLTREVEAGADSVPLSGTSIEVRLAHSCNGVARLLPNDPRRREQYHLQALGIFEKVAVTLPDYRWWVGGCHRELALLWNSQGRNQEAADAHRKAKTVYDNLAREHPDDPGFRFMAAHTNLDLSRLLLATPEHRQEGEQLSRQAIDVFKKLTVDFPDNLQYQQALKQAEETAASGR
jgi:serine/threonine protein kinase